MIESAVIDDDSQNEVCNGICDSDSVEECILVCNETNKPFVGRKFPTLQEAEQFYRSYRGDYGFDVRLGQLKKSTDGTIIIRYMYCNREGIKIVISSKVNNNSGVFHTKRRRVSTRVSCQAKVIFRFCGHDGYMVDVFKEGHTHSLVSESFKHFMKCNRNLDPMHQSFILNCQKAIMGPMKSFRLFKEIVGSYKSVGCSSVEFKNFTRDLRAYVEGVDAQIVLNKLHNKQEIFSEFIFDYCVNESEKLTRLFWADPVAIKMNKAFGEAVSFDATYSTNKYNMIFAPFTGKDNHSRCVTFAAGLLSREDVDSYVWILQKFVSCMKKPNLIITDQDPALKIAVARVLPDTTHRFCMWHIMLKVADKIPVYISEDEGFTEKFNEIVWSEHIEPHDFDIKWHGILEEYELADHEWFATMFELCGFWIPAYFKDVEMGGLFRTTSMSESENSFFRKYNNKNANLLHFMMHFDSAIDAQRDSYDKMCSVDEFSTPTFRKECFFERHAASVYTTQIFLKVQKDISSAGASCGIVNIAHTPEIITYDIDDSWLNQSFQVKVSEAGESFYCECKHFLKHGLLCRHIYLVFKNMHVRKIPAKYIVPRWTKYACSKECVDARSDKTDSHNEKIYLLNQLHLAASRSIGVVGDDVDRMKGLLKDFNDMHEKYSIHASISTGANAKQMAIESFYGSSLPKDISVLPPDKVKIKGSGSRLKLRKEKAIRDANKPKRRCSKCKEMVNHDARNCDKDI